MNQNTTIAALATNPGMAAIAVIRISGPTAFEVVGKVFHPYGGKKLETAEGYTILFGKMQENGRKIDEVLVSIFRGPHSYTGEDTLEISCHGSVYVQQELLQLLYRIGAEPAKAGEFTLRAFMNGKLDLSQAEAVADLISAGNQTAHALAMQQLRGGFGDEIRKLRTELLNFLALIELELDFSTEDVEFADRGLLETLVKHIRGVVNRLKDSYAMGNVLKNGIPVTIAGKPNAGKSTLLNALLNEERAIVSDIAGTTRDTIEDVLVLDGMAFRFIDTAGLRKTDDVVENIGIERSFKSIREASIVLYLFDYESFEKGEVNHQLKKIQDEANTNTLVIPVMNKADKLDSIPNNLPENTLVLSALNKTGLNELTNHLVQYAHYGKPDGKEVVVTNARHYHALNQSSLCLDQVLRGLELRLPGDLLSADIRDALDALSEITGEVTNEEVLGTIFGKFCIGK